MPVAGLRVTIKSGGKIVGNDVTSQQGQTTFQLLYGQYTGVIHNETGILRSFSLRLINLNSSTQSISPEPILSSELFPLPGGIIL